jgi:hypothetical protein
MPGPFLSNMLFEIKTLQQLSPECLYFNLQSRLKPLGMRTLHTFRQGVGPNATAARPPKP